MNEALLTIYVTALESDTVYAELLANIIFGGLLKKCCWRDFKLAVLSTACRETHACSINGSIMVHINLVIFMSSPNCQIKITVNISAYTVYQEVCNDGSDLSSNLKEALIIITANVQHFSY